MWIPGVMASHHNPNLNREDDLFYNALAVDRVIEGLF